MTAIGEHPNLGVLLVPANRQYVTFGMPFGIDNSAFGGKFNEKAYVRTLGYMAERKLQPMWVAVPDVVGDAVGTLELWEKWAPRLRDWPLAFVAQDGLTPTMVPWSDMAAIFIGGTTEFKLSRMAEAFMLEAKRRDKLVHVGRVNSLRRMRWCHERGADTVDGTKCSMFAETYLRRYLLYLESLDSQECLFGAGEQNAEAEN